MVSEFETEFFSVKQDTEEWDDEVTPVDTFSSRIYMTSLGPFDSIKAIIDATGRTRMTIGRWYGFTDKKLEWYIIDSIDTPLQPDELCEACDTIDDLFFKEKCWVVYVQHEHHTKSCDTVVTYCYDGEDYKVNLTDWSEGIRPHKQEKVI